MTKHKHPYDQTKKPKKNVPAAPSTENKTDTDTHCSQSTNKFEFVQRFWGLTKAEWIMSILTFFGIAIAVLTGLIFYFQLDEMRNDERAWIGVHTEPVKFAANEILSDKLQVTNIGKTPAKSVMVVSAIEIIKSTEAPDFGSPTKQSHVVHQNFLGDLYPNDHVDIDLPRNDMNSVPLPMTSSEYNDLANGQSYVASFGHVWYRDIFSKKHDRVFCYWFPYHPGIGIAHYETGTCTGHNTEDDPNR